MGWRYGEKYDADLKTHPDMVPYAELGQLEQDKDAVFIAELATSPEKYARDREKYNVNPTNGDRIRYRHVLPVNAQFGSRQFTLVLSERPWVLHVLKRMKWLRKVAWSWHRKERRFARQYEQRLQAFAAAPADSRDCLPVTRASSATAMLKSLIAM